MPGTGEPNPYLRTQVMTASPAELRLMLLEGAVRFAEQGKAGLEERDHEKAFTGISRAQDIVMELLTTLKPEHSPELCERLSGLYVFIFTRLITASTDRDPALMAEAINLLRYECETWRMLLEQEGAAPADGATAESGATPGSISVQG